MIFGEGCFEPDPVTLKIVNYINIELIRGNPDSLIDCALSDGKRLDLNGHDIARLSIHEMRSRG